MMRGVGTRVIVSGLPTGVPFVGQSNSFFFASQDDSINQCFGLRDVEVCRFES